MTADAPLILQELQRRASSTNKLDASMHLRVGDVVDRPMGPLLNNNVKPLHEQMCAHETQPVWEVAQDKPGIGVPNDYTLSLSQVQALAAKLRALDVRHVNLFAAPFSISEPQ